MILVYDAITTYIRFRLLWCSWVLWLEEVGAAIAKFRKAYALY